MAKNVPPLDVTVRGGLLTPEGVERFAHFLLREDILVYDAHEDAAACLHWYQRPFKRWLIDWTQGTHVRPMRASKIKRRFR